MKLQQFLAHHGIRENPFGQEDASSDQVFKQHCLNAVFHPAWDKIVGNPGEPSTAVVFGEKGAGKTALRLQLVDHIKRHNLAQPEQRMFVIEYDDFNPFLDSFRDRLPTWSRSAERALASWRLWDHMDAILVLGVTRLVSTILDDRGPQGTGTEVRADQLARLTRLQRRDLLLLTTFYDYDLSMPRVDRWSGIRRKTRFWSPGSWRDFAIGVAGTVSVLGGLFWANNLVGLGKFWPWWALLIGVWLPFAWKHGRLFWTGWRMSRQVRIVDNRPNLMRDLLSRFAPKELADQPVPSRDRSDDRYELIKKFQGVLAALGFTGITIIVDRVDEPHLINGSPDRMRALLWPLFDNKFLKHPGLGFKLLLPIEVSTHLRREDKEFFERSRLDKQNLVQSLLWTGESLYDIANDRLRACSSDESKASFRKLFDESITEQELIASLARLRVPRHMFKFLYRLVVDHCNRYTDESPRWTIARETLQSSLALYERDLQDFDRGVGTG
jgi:hypothetical protein